MLHSRTANITILSNQPKFPYPTKITVNADFELFGNLPLLAVYSELFRITQDRLVAKKLEEIADVDGEYRDPETFAFYTDKGYIELKITMLPVGVEPSEYQISFNPMHMIHETHLMVEKGFKRNNKVYGNYGLCMLNVLNPLEPRKFVSIAETDEHILQASVAVDLETKAVEFTDTTKPNTLRMYEVEMANLFFGHAQIQELLSGLALKLVEMNRDQKLVLSTFNAKYENRKASIELLVSESLYDDDL